MLKVMKIVFMGYVLFLSECYSMPTSFASTITENATNKVTLFANLSNIGDEKEKKLANEYTILYGANELAGENRKKVLSSIVPVEKNTIIGAAAYVVKSLFGRAKKEIYEMDALDECIRVATLLLADAPQLASGRPMDNIGSILQAAICMRQQRATVAANLSESSIGKAFGFVANVVFE